MQSRRGSYIVKHGDASLWRIRCSDLGSNHIDFPSVLSKLVTKGLSVTGRMFSSPYPVCRDVEGAGGLTYPLPVLDPQPTVMDPPSGRIRR